MAQKSFYDCFIVFIFRSYLNSEVNEPEFTDLLIPDKVIKHTHTLQSNSWNLNQNKK